MFFPLFDESASTIGCAAVFGASLFTLSTYLELYKRTLVLHGMSAVKELSDEGIKVNIRRKDSVHYALIEYFHRNQSRITLIGGTKYIFSI
jgi:hypothetical protein